MSSLLVDRAPIVVATDGRGRTRSVLECARLIARRAKRTVHVIAVLEPWPWYGIDGIVSAEVEALEERNRDELRRGVSEELAHVLGPEHGWTIHVRTGHVARCIAELARETKAGLIMLGLGRRSPLDRLFGRETALRTLRMASCPIFAVADDAPGLPHRAVVATDFSASSLHAADCALPLMADEAELCLLHVRAPMRALLPMPAEWEGPYEAHVADLFLRMRGRLANQRPVRLQTLLVRGNTVDEVIASAQGQQADLLVAGSHGHGLVERLLVGSVATGLLRRAQCSVFVAPPPSAREAALIEEALTHELLTNDPEEFADTLASFARRNAGRPARLEVDDLTIGAQVQEEGLTLVGAAYDHHDRQVQLMLEDPAMTGHHVTHCIRDAVSLAIVEDDNHRDRALRVAHGGGQTLLQFA